MISNTFQLYHDPLFYQQDISHYESDLTTKVSEDYFDLVKCKGGAKPESRCEKIIMNHLYHYT